VTHTCAEWCVRKPKDGRVAVGIESPVVHGKKPVRTPPATFSELEKAVPYEGMLYYIE